MLWLIWRQHRLELAGALALLALTAAFLVDTGLTMRHSFDADGVAGCLAHTGRDGCDRIVDAFQSRFGGWADRMASFTFLPVLAGVFVGAPLLGREFEHGTWKLAFTQSVTRTRWIAVKLTAVGLGVLLVAAAFTALFTWWRAPLDAVDGRFGDITFNLEGVAFAATALFAFAVGALAGTLVRGLVAAMGLALISYFAVRTAIEQLARPLLLTPRTRITEAVTEPGVPGAYSRDWRIGDGLIDASGHRLSDAEYAAVLNRVYGDGMATYGSGTPIEKYLATHGLRHYTDYHPAGSFWIFQLAELGLYLALTAALLAATVHLIRRRTS
jgi:hypothetical protein